MNGLELEIVRPSGTAPLTFLPQRVVNAGYAGRNEESVRRHVEELRREGVAPPPSVPMFYALPCAGVTTEARIETVAEKTSGEVEYVLLAQADRVLVGIGSDHTDRALETIDVLKSKQACPNVLGRTVWDFADVSGHWDQLQLQSWVRANPSDPWSLYQDAPVAALLTPARLMDLIRNRISDRRIQDMIIYSGTIPASGGHVVYGGGFRCSLFDPVLQRSLECDYDVAYLGYLEPKAASATA